MAQAHPSSAPPLRWPVTFQPGETVRTVVIPVADNASDDMDRAFTVQLSGATGAVLVNGDLVAEPEEHLEVRLRLISGAHQGRMSARGTILTDD